MQLTRRPAGPAPGAVADAGLAITGIALTALAAWGHAGSFGTPIAGPPWLRAVLPLLLGAPLALRRRAPLLMWTLLWASISLQALITRDAPAGLELLFILCVGSYSLAAHASLHRALAGLAIMAPAAVIYVLASHQMGSGILAVHGTGTGPWHTAGLFFTGEILACWLIGIVVRARRRAAALRQQARGAVAAERARIARELHDIVAHHLSVVVLQAAAARASGSPDTAALEKIEHSGRQALTEMRRLLGILRDPHEETGLTPQPGIGDLAALADSVRGSGLPVHLVIDADHTGLPAAVSVSAYRIVQEALTNILKHAGPAHAEVAVTCAGDAVTIEVTDDGTGPPASPAHPGGHGLAGMRERAAILGGELAAGPRPGGGFAVQARLPLTSEPS
jgi:signal transduction histidine kinase